mmetsp:Transcript_1342/g.3308  ORF Transcript_1342/g.3308 Transcript_1342/m.3308 type:complete len:288 (-) Transcript_1342:1235-2098(-)
MLGHLGGDEHGRGLPVRRRFRRRHRFVGHVERDVDGKDLQGRLVLQLPDRFVGRDERRELRVDLRERQGVRSERRRLGRPIGDDLRADVLRRRRVLPVHLELPRRIGVQPRPGCRRRDGHVQGFRVPVPGDAPGRTVVPSAEQRLLLDQQRPDGHPVPVPDPNAEPGRFGRADGGGIGGADPSAVRQRRGGLRGPLAASRKRPRKEVQQGPDPRRRLLCGDLQERREQPLPVRRQQPSLHPEAPGQGRHHVRRGRGLPRPEAGPAVRQVTGPSELSRDVRRNLPPVK